MWLLRLLVTTALIMFVFPHFGLMGFEGGVLGGLWASLVVSVVGGIVSLLLFPLIIAGVLGAAVSGGLLAGQFGARLMLFALYTGLYALILTIAAGLLSGVTLLGAGPTFGAAAILALVSAVLHNVQVQQS